VRFRATFFGCPCPHASERVQLRTETCVFRNRKNLCLSPGNASTVQIKKSQGLGFSTCAKPGISPTLRYLYKLHKVRLNAFNYCLTCKIHLNFTIIVFKNILKHQRKCFGSHKHFHYV